MELELRHLKAIRAIAETGSLNKAAGLLGVAQPALSTQLKRIERALGGALFLRDRSGARPTPLGELVLERAQVVLPAVQELQDEAIRFARAMGSVRRLRVGGTHGPLLGGLVDKLTTAYPDVSVGLHTAWSVTEISSLAAVGRVDIALIGVCGQSPPPEGDRLLWQPVGTDPVFVMLAEGHPRAAERELELAQLAGERWVSAPGDGCFGDCFVAACSRAGFSPASFYETDVAACVHLVQVGTAVGLCRATLPPTPGVVVRPLAGAPLSWRHLLGRRPDSPPEPVASDILGHARGVYGEAVRRSAGFPAWLAEHPEFGTASWPGPATS
ncbi:LysR family transcriptional regulator [Streptomyces johnsoniae]|uniref:LysR family transcriptional regulator n=1 Tax=Streptomyces johnsoniae TaxID=3075532 RepID=A0ABU2SGF0_9ACTN|nr:LysR family transcriptional regulator [Streptomyces sp. DSM 41886]MDT0447170.1 LysR family transcriptional regulator [Streptomyces sp. DSM 41886]